MGQTVNGVELVLLPTRDRDLIAKARAAGRFWAIDTGHDLMITEPKAVAEALRDVAAR